MNTVYGTPLFAIDASPPCDEVRPHDPHIVVGNVRELRPSLGVAERPDSRRSRTQLVVNLDESAGVGLDAGDLQAEAIRIRSPPHREKEVRALEMPLALRTPNSQRDTRARRLDLCRRRFEQDLDTVLAQNVCDRVGDVGILAAEELRTALNDCHIRSEAPEHLSELEPDVSAADDHQVLRRLVELHDRRRVQVRHVVDTFDLRQGRAAPTLKKMRSGVQGKLARGCRHLASVRTSKLASPKISSALSIVSTFFCPPSRKLSTTVCFLRRTSARLTETGPT